MTPKSFKREQDSHRVTVQHKVRWPCGHVEYRVKPMPGEKCATCRASGESRRNERNGLRFEPPCVTPTGRTDGHGAYVEVQDGKVLCAFCRREMSSMQASEKEASNEAI